MANTKTHLADPQFANCGSAKLRYFIFMRMKNAGGAPSGATVALAFPSTVRSSVTVGPSDENKDSFSSKLR